MELVIEVQPEEVASGNRRCMWCRCTNCEGAWDRGCVGLGETRRGRPRQL